MKKHYRLYRTMAGAVHPYLKPVYRTLDRKIMAGAREIPVRVFHPRHRDDDKVLLFFHGGGWVTGDINSYTRVCAIMARQTGRTVISVDYRLAPEHPYPAGLEDCYEAARALFQHPDMIRCTCSDITLVGDSAGGNLAAAVSLMARDRGEFLPRRQILLYPATYWDHGPGSPFPSVNENGRDYILTARRVQNYMELYAPAERDRRSPYVAPLTAENLSDQPDTLVITAQYDPLRDEGEAYGRRLRESGNRVRVFRIDDALHGFLTLPRHSRPVKECYEIIRSFLDRQENSG